MTASQFIAALQAGLNAAADAAAATPSQPGTATPQVSVANNPMPAPGTVSQAGAAATAAKSTPGGDWIAKYFSWLIPAGWTPAKLA